MCHGFSWVQRGGIDSHDHELVIIETVTFLILQRRHHYYFILIKRSDQDQWDLQRSSTTGSTMHKFVILSVVFCLYISQASCLMLQLNPKSEGTN